MGVPAGQGKRVSHREETEEKHDRRRSGRKQWNSQKKAQGGADLATKKRYASNILGADNPPDYA